MAETWEDHLLQKETLNRLGTLNGNLANLIAVLERIERDLRNITNLRAMVDALVPTPAEIAEDRELHDHPEKRLRRKR